MARSTPQKTPSKYRCTVEKCTQEFMRSAELKEHLRNHLISSKKSKQFQCPFAGCTFITYQKAGLNIHKAVKHKNQKLHQCTDDPATCSFSTDHPGSLTRHRKTAHGAGLAATPSSSRSGSEYPREAPPALIYHPGPQMGGGHDPYPYGNGAGRSTTLCYPNGPLQTVVYVQDTPDGIGSASPAPFAHLYGRYGSGSDFLDAFAPQQTQHGLRTGFLAAPGGDRGPRHTTSLF